jgi:ABC-type transport system involved in multi-copper enzyme maturation permease subunit
MAINVSELLWKNPVTIKELRGRMRGPRAFAVMTIYLLLMAGFAVTLYVLYGSALTLSDTVAQGGTIGRTLFTGIVGIELFLVTFIVPAFTAGAITGERERQTYDLLKTTLLAPRAFVVGKLISALSYIFLLLLAAIPLQSIAFLFGGVSESEIALAFVILLVTGIALGTIGLYFSAIMQRTLAASIATYGFALVITIGLPVIMVVIVSVLGPFFLALFGGRSSGTLGLPIFVQALMWYGFGVLVCTNPLATAFVTQSLLVERQEAGIFTQTLASSGTTTVIPLISPWIIFCVFYLILSGILIIATIRRVNKIEVIEMTDKGPQKSTSA